MTETKPAARPLVKLTEKIVAASVPDLREGKPVRTEIGDQLVPNLKLRIEPSGTKAWLLRYRRNNSTMKVVLGRWGAPIPGSATEPVAGGILSVEGARIVARAALSRLATGHDPASVKASAESDDSFTSVARRHMVRALAPNLRTWGESAWALGWGRADASKPISLDNLAPIPAPSPLTEWGARPFASITRRDVAELLAKIEDRRGAARATKVRAALSRLWGWSIGQGLSDLSPVAGIPKPIAFVPRDRTLDDREISALLVALRKLERDPKTTAAAFWPATRFMLATALRREEASGLLWSEVDFDNAVLRISADRMKSGRGHLVPLSPVAIEVLKARPRHLANPYVFTSGHGKATGLAGWSKAMATIQAAFKEPIPPWSLHDLRRTFAAGAARRGVRLEVVERCLAHRTGATVGGLQAVYQTYDFMAEQKAAMETWGEAIRSLMPSD